MAVVLAVMTQQNTHTQVGPSDLQTLRIRLQKADLLAIPVDVEEIAEFLGLDIRSELMKDDISGYLEYQNGAWIVGVNAQHHVNRQRFTIAHEIAHYILHRDPKKEFVDETFARRSSGGDKVEREADEFAAELLMPEQDIRKAIEQGRTSFQELATLFRVSALAIRFRVKALGYAVK